MNWTSLKRWRKATVAFKNNSLIKLVDTEKNQMKTKSMEINHAINKTNAPQDTVIIWICELENNNEEFTFNAAHHDRD